VGAAAADVVQSHGLWLAPNLYAARAAARAGRPHVISPRGMLGPAALEFSRLKKRAFWALAQARAVRAAACLHATSELERQDIRAFGLTNPVAIVPNGVDVPPLQPKPQRQERTALSLGRLHPKKGLDRLVRAWALVEAEHPDWRLRIVGPAEGGYDDQLRALAAELSLQRVSVEGAVYGEAARRLYQQSDLFILPTLNENFAMTVAEALANCVPVISTKGAPWSGLEREGCGWWIDHGEEPMAATLRLVLATPRELLAAMGSRGRAWMLREFSWGRIAADLLEVYDWLSCGKPRPATVRLD
jgi:glycosyltransferase involved in cell wall biosynthesis